jgi:Flp pilus assembly protein TadB
MNWLLPLVAFALGVLWWMQYRQQRRITMKLSELSAALETVNTTLDKVVAEVEALKATLTNVDLPTNAQAALDRLVATAAALDALNDDLPVTPPVEPPV